MFRRGSKIRRDSEGIGIAGLARFGLMHCYFVYDVWPDSANSLSAGCTSLLRSARQNRSAKSEANPASFQELAFAAMPDYLMGEFNGGCTIARWLREQPLLAVILQEP